MSAPQAANTRGIRTPDVLVLGVGGILGEAWMSAVLAGLDEHDAFDARGCGGYVGTSAGSIVAAALAAGVAPGSRLGSLPEPPAVSTAGTEPEDPWHRRALGAAFGIASGTVAPLASLALASTAPGGALLRRTALARVPLGRRSLAGLGGELERWGVRWDGRLRIVAVDLDSGRRVVLGASGARELSVSAAVQASCAIPGVFRPVRAGGRRFVDGGAWSPTNIDVAEVTRGARVLCLNPTGSLRPGLAEPAGAIGPVSRAIAAAETLVLRRRGASVTTINPDAGARAAIGTNLMDSRPRAAVIAAGIEQGRRLAGR